MAHMGAGSTLSGNKFLAPLQVGDKIELMLQGVAEVLTNKHVPLSAASLGRIHTLSRHIVTLIEERMGGTGPSSGAAAGMGGMAAATTTATFPHNPFAIAAAAAAGGSGGGGAGVGAANVLLNSLAQQENRFFSSPAAAAAAGEDPLLSQADSLQPSALLDPYTKRRAKPAAAANPFAAAGQNQLDEALLRSALAQGIGMDALAASLGVSGGGRPAGATAGGAGEDLGDDGDLEMLGEDLLGDEAGEASEYDRFARLLGGAGPGAGGGAKRGSAGAGVAATSSSNTAATNNAPASSAALQATANLLKEIANGQVKPSGLDARAPPFIPGGTSTPPTGPATAATAGNAAANAFVNLSDLRAMVPNATIRPDDPIAGLAAAGLLTGGSSASAGRRGMISVQPPPAPPGGLPFVIPPPPPPGLLAAAGGAAAGAGGIGVPPGFPRVPMPGVLNAPPPQPTTAQTAAGKQKALSAGAAAGRPQQPSATAPGKPAAPGAPSSSSAFMGGGPQQASSITDCVLHILKTNHAARAAQTIGWEALKHIWSINPEDIDESVTSFLTTRTARQQNEILLAMAADDLSNVSNLSAFLNSLIKEHQNNSQVCMHFLADLCEDPSNCTSVHPINTPGWNLLRDRWGVTYKDMDYTVLNYLSKKSPEEREQILEMLAETNLRQVNNLSAYLSATIQKFESSNLNRSSSAAGKPKLDPK